MKSFALLLLLLLPLSVWGQTQTLVNLPGAEGDFNTYINSIYTLAISIAALLAVIKIVIAGVKWMTTDVVSSKGDAKKDIQGALFGLLVIIGAVIILTVINPNLLEVNLTMREMQTPDPSEWGGGSGGDVPEDVIQRVCPDPDSDCIVATCPEIAELSWGAVITGVVVGAVAAPFALPAAVTAGASSLAIVAAGGIGGGYVTYEGIVGGNAVACAAFCTAMPGNSEITTIQGENRCVYQPDSLADGCEEREYCSVVECDQAGEITCAEARDKCEMLYGQPADFGEENPRVLCGSAFISDIEDSLGFTPRPENVVGSNMLNLTGAGSLTEIMGVELSNFGEYELDLLGEYLVDTTIDVSFLEEQLAVEIDEGALEQLRSEVGCTGGLNRVGFLRFENADDEPVVDIICAQPSS